MAAQMDFHVISKCILLLICSSLQLLSASRCDSNPFNNTPWNSALTCSDDVWRLNVTDVDASGSLALSNSSIVIENGTQLHVFGSLSGGSFELKGGHVRVVGNLTDVNSMLFELRSFNLSNPTEGTPYSSVPALVADTFTASRVLVDPTNTVNNTTTSKFLHVLMLPTFRTPPGGAASTLLLIQTQSSSNSTTFVPSDLLASQPNTIFQCSSSIVAQLFHTTNVVVLSLSSQTCSGDVPATTTAVATGTGTDSNTSDDNKNTGRSTTGIVVGVLFGVAALVTLVVVAAWWWRRQRQWAVRFSLIEEAYTASNPGRTIEQDVLVALPNRAVTVSGDSLSDPTVECIVPSNNEIIASNLAASRFSLYPFLRVGENEFSSTERLGDPVADTFGVIMYPNLYLVCIADGCGWGKSAHRASMICSKTLLQFLSMHRRRMRSLRLIGRLLCKSLEVTHLDIVDDHTSDVAGRTTVLGGAALRIPNSNQWDFVYVAVGDCKVFLYEKSKNNVVDLTAQMTALRDSGADSGGYIGADAPSAMNGRSKCMPDLRNLSLGHCTCDTDDILIFLSDGIHDNLLPVHFGLTPNEVDSTVEYAQWDRMPVDERNRLSSRWRLKKMQKLFEDLGSDVTPSMIATTLMQIAKSNSAPARAWLENPNNKGKLPKNVPGKLDHATVVTVQLRMPNVSSTVNSSMGNTALVSVDQSREMV